MAALIPIPSLDPESIPPPDKAIRAVVSLYWPYSSSTKQCALLLADRDFRLRSRRGQVRVRFTSASATAVAQGKVGIGDEVLLDLRGAQWASDSSRVATPGKSVEGELVYRGELSLRIVKKAGSSAIVDQHLSVNESTPPPEQEQEVPRNQTPAGNTRVSSLRNSLGGVDLVPIYSSPAFVRRQRLSGNSLVKDDVFDPFADIDRELENEQPRKRQRISDVSSWRFAGRSPSPEKHMHVDRASDHMNVDATAASIGQDEIEHVVEQTRNDTRHSTESLEIRQDLQQPPPAADIEDDLQDSGPLPAKLSPLPPGVSDFTTQNQAGTTMLPPPLPQLQMPEDPFIASSQDSGQTSDLPSEGPATPKLKAVPGYTLPLPSPFPQETPQPPFESQIAAAQAASRSNAINDQQTTVSESTSDDGIRLQINPTITALARQRRKASRSPNSAKQVGTDSLNSPDRRPLGRHELQSPEDSSYVYPDVESAYDTEEDEEMQNLYSQQVQSHAKELLEREGVKTRDWVHQADAAEVIEDMGEEPETSSDDESDEDGEEASDDDEILSFQGEEDEDIQSAAEQPKMSAVPEISKTLTSQHEAALEKDQTLIDVTSRSPAPSAATLPTEPASASASMKTGLDTMSVEKPADVKERQPTEPTKNQVEVSRPQSVPTAATTTKEAVRALPPKTPAKTMQSLFGFSYGMDGTNDTPPQVTKPTPQSEKDRIMKKTYSSLFGFKASPSPEKERAPAPVPKLTEPETTFGRVDAAETTPTSKPLDVSQGTLAETPLPVNPPAASPTSAASRTHDELGSLKPAVDPHPTREASASYNAHASIVPETVPTQPADITDGSDDKFGSLDVQLSEMSQTSQSPDVLNETPIYALPDITQTQRDAYKTAAGNEQFGSLEVQLSDVSDDGQDTSGSIVSQDDPLNSKSVGARAVQESQPTQATTPSTDSIKQASTIDPYSTQDMRETTPVAFADVQPALQTVQPDESFDDEASVASMLNVATPRPVRTTGHNHTDASPETSPARTVIQEIKTEPGASSISSDTRPMPLAPPSTAPVRSLGSQKIHAPPPSTAPRPSQVEVIDLGSSDDSSDAQSDDDQYDEAVASEFKKSVPIMRHAEAHTKPFASQPSASQMPRAIQVTSQDLMVDEPEDGAEAYSPTEVASSPRAVDAMDIEMHDAMPLDDDEEEDDVSQNQSSPAPLQTVENDSLMPDAHHESFFKDGMEASGFDAAEVAPARSQRRSQMSEAPSTQSRNIADQYHYFSFQADGSELASSDGEDDDANDLPAQASQTTDLKIVMSEEEVSQPKSTARSEVIEISSSPPPAASQPVTTRSGVKVPQSSEQSQKETSQTETAEDKSQVLASLAAGQASSHAESTRTEVKRTPEVQVAASSFVEDSMDPARHPETQLPRLPSPEASQSSQFITVLESQHRLESQPFETQLPAPGSRQPILPPTPEITNEGLKVVVDTPAEDPPPTTSTARKHKRNASSKDISASVRRSPRKADTQSQPEPAAQVTTLRQTRSQRTASPEPSQVTTTRQTRSQRTATPETDRPVTNSFDSTLLTPEPPKPLRRSPRKSQTHTESFESIEEVNESNEPAKSPRATTRKSPRKSQEMKRKSAEEEDISPPPKRTTAAEKLLGDPGAKQEPAIQPAALSSKKTPSKRSFTSRFGNVPEVISAWFSPRRSTRPSLDEDETKVDSSINEKPELLQRTSSNGIITSSAYYTPLSNLDQRLNPSSQPGVDNTIDILAVVADETKAPERAKGGPRDYFTIFKIADPSSGEAKAFTSVDVFRPWHATLPVAKVGDVVLLRGFAVKSRKRQPYLLSTDASAWLVWRFDEGDGMKRPGTATSPRRTRRSSVVGLGAREETKGPPVELGEEERQRAKELRAWWLTLSPEKKGESSKSA